MNIASVGLRIGGGLIDLVVSFVIVLVFGWITGLGDTYQQEGQMGVNISGWPFFFASLIVLAIFAAMEAWFGKTPGKFLVGTRVTDASGDPITVPAAVIRNVLRIVDGFAFYLVGLIIVAVDGENRRLGDIVAKTRVVRDK